MVKCEAHTSRTDKIAIGNCKADEMAKVAAVVRESVMEPHMYIFWIPYDETLAKLATGKCI